MSIGTSRPGYLSPAEAKRFYDRFGSWQDSQRFYESRAVDDLIAHADFGSAHVILEFGCGTGALAANLLGSQLPPDARYLGFDISTTMVALARKRVAPWSIRACVCETDGSPFIPKQDQSLDRLLSTYVLDLLSPESIRQLLTEARRLLVPGGKLCLVSLTFGNSCFTGAVSWIWQHLWRLSPRLLGGCRPIRLLDYVRSAGWCVEYRAAVAQYGITSEVVVASPK